MDSLEELEIKNQIAFVRCEDQYELWREKYDAMTLEEQLSPTSPELGAIYLDFFAAMKAHDVIADEITRRITGEYGT